LKYFFLPPFTNHKGHLISLQLSHVSQSRTFLFQISLVSWALVRACR
jgi:hypothetical protein